MYNKYMKENIFKSPKGFTLIELLVVMLILTLLFALVLVAINPVRQRQQANNTQRRNDLNTLLNAIYQFAAEKGQLPSSITTSLKIIGTAATGCASLCGATTPQDACANLTADLTTTYINEIPFDPKTGNSAITRYAVFKSSVNNRVTVVACDAELNEEIEVAR